MFKILIFVMAVVALSIGCRTPSAKNTVVVATIRQVTGEAEVRSGKAEWARAQAGQKLRDGDEARTLGNAEMDVQLSPHGGVFTLKGESEIEVERLGARADEPNAVAVLRLTRGRVIGNTLKLPKGMKVVVKTNGGTFQIP